VCCAVSSQSAGSILCVVLLVGEPVYGVDSITDSSLLTVLSHRYITTQHGTAAGTGPGTYSSQHGAAYSSQCGVGGYFASEGQEPTAHHILPGQLLHSQVTLMLTLRA